MICRFDGQLIALKLKKAAIGVARPQALRRRSQRLQFHAAPISYARPKDFGLAKFREYVAARPQ